MECSERSLLYSFGATPSRVHLARMSWLISVLCLLTLLSSVEAESSFLRLFGLVPRSAVLGAQSQVMSLQDRLDGCQESLDLRKMDFRWYQMLLERRNSSLISLTSESLACSERFLGTSQRMHAWRRKVTRKVERLKNDLVRCFQESNTTNEELDKVQKSCSSCETELKSCTKTKAGCQEELSFSKSKVETCEKMNNDLQSWTLWDYSRITVELIGLVIHLMILWRWIRFKTAETVGALEQSESMDHALRIQLSAARDRAKETKETLAKTESELDVICTDLLRSQRENTCLLNENNDLKKEMKVLQLTMKEKHREEIQQRDKEVSVIKEELNQVKVSHKRLELQHDALKQERTQLWNSHCCVTEEHKKLQKIYSDEVQQREKDGKELSFIKQELKLEKEFRSSLEARHQTLQQERDILSHSHNTLSEEHEKLKESFCQYQLEFEKKFQEEVHKRRTEVAAIRDQLKQQEKEMKFLEVQNKVESQQHTQLLDSHKAFLQEHEHLKKSYSEEIERREKESSRLQKELEVQKEEHKSLQVQHRALHSEHKQLWNSYGSIAQEQDKLKKTHFKELENRDKVKRELSQIKDELKVLKECRESLEAQHKALKEERDNLFNRHDALTREHQKLMTDYSQEIPRKENELSEIREQLKVQTQCRVFFEAQIEAQKRYFSLVRQHENLGWNSVQLFRRHGAPVDSSADSATLDTIEELKSTIHRLAEEKRLVEDKLSYILEDMAELKDQDLCSPFGAPDSMEVSPERYDEYVEGLLRQGLKVVPTPPDGNCLYRSFAILANISESQVLEIRRFVMNFLKDNATSIIDREALNTFKLPEYVFFHKVDGVSSDRMACLALAHAFQLQVHLYNLAVPGEPIFEIYRDRKCQNVVRILFNGNGHFEAILPL